MNAFIGEEKPKEVAPLKSKTVSRKRKFNEIDFDLLKDNSTGSILSPTDNTLVTKEN